MDVQIRGVTSPPRYSDIQRQALDLASSVLRENGDLAFAASQVAEAAEAFLSAVAQAIPALDTKLGQLACGRGCASCCHQVVGLTVAEGVRIKAFLAAQPSDRRAEILRKVREVKARGAGLNPGQWWAARIPCPLLDGDGACLAHAVRPLPCRGYCSTDLQACLGLAAGSQTIAPFLAAPMRVYGHAQAGLAQALAAHGMGGVTTLTEFLSALSVDGDSFSI